MSARLFIRAQDANTRAAQKLFKSRLVGSCLRSIEEAGPEFAKNDERKVDFISIFNNVDDGLITAKKVRVTVGVQR